MPGRFLIALAATLPMSVALCAALAYALPGGWRASAIGAMTLLFPLWIGIASALLGVSSSRRLTVLALAGNAVAFALLVTAKHVSPIL